jgi:hypothetical protein
MHWGEIDANVGVGDAGKLESHGWAPKIGIGSIISTSRHKSQLKFPEFGTSPGLWN